METLSEQVARLARERDIQRTRAERAEANEAALCMRVKALEQSRMKVWHELSAAESRLADAERRGAREAFVAGGMWADPEMSHAYAVREAENRYPAVPPEREGAGPDEVLSCEKAGYCVAPTACKPGVQCFTRPTQPQAAPETLEDVVVLTEYEFRGEWHQHNELRLRFTPELCQRIVETARRASGREDA